MPAQLWRTTPLVICFLATCTGASKIAESATEKQGVSSDPVLSEFDSGMKDGFASATSKLPQGEFEARLASVFQRGKADPSHAEIAGDGYNLEGGFASRTNMFFNELALAMYFNKSFVACDIGFMKAVIPDYYSIGIPLAEGGAPKCGAYIGNGMCHKFGAHLMLTQFDYITALKRFLHRSVMTLKPDILAQIDAHLGEAGFNHQKVQYLGVHIRHGDKAGEMVDERLLPTHLYADAIKPLLLKYSLKRIWVASDDPGAGKAMRDLLKEENVTVWQHFSTTSASRTYNDEDIMMPLLVDMEALKRSTVFVGTHTSNMGSVVFYGRTATAVSISLDVPWNEVPPMSSDAHILPGSQ